MAPVRMCKICRTRKPQAELRRLVLDPAKPGRGTYVCDRPECLKRMKVTA